MSGTPLVELQMSNGTSVVAGARLGTWLSALHFQSIMATAALPSLDEERQDECDVGKDERSGGVGESSGEGGGRA